MLPDMSRLKLGPRSRPIGAGADEVVASVGDKRAAPAGSGGEEAAAEAPPPPEAVRWLLREAERVVQELREARVYSPYWQAEADALLEEAERLLLEQAEPPEAARPWLPHQRRSMQWMLQREAMRDVFVPAAARRLPLVCLQPELAVPLSRCHEHLASVRAPAHPARLDPRTACLSSPGL